MYKIRNFLSSVCFLVLCFVNNPFLIAAKAADIEFSVGADGGVTISGGGFPDLSADANIGSSLNDVLGKYKTVAVFIFGICTVTAFLLMIFSFTKLAVAGDNERARKKAIVGILTTGIATALLGGITIVVGFFWNALNVDDASA